MSGFITIKDHNLQVCERLGIDAHYDLGQRPYNCYRDVIIIGDYKLTIDIPCDLVCSSFNPSQKRFEIVKKQIEVWKSELPLKNKAVLIDKNHDRNC